MCYKTSDIALFQKWFFCELIFANQNYLLSLRNRIHVKKVGQQNLWSSHFIVQGVIRSKNVKFPQSVLSDKKVPNFGSKSGKWTFSEKFQIRHFLVPATTHLVVKFQNLAPNRAKTAHLPQESISLRSFTYVIFIHLLSFIML